jgi:glycerol-3-phosphate cytidylyltransferase-like family protein
MKLLELLEDDSRDLVIIYPGRFHPFHIGHGKVYKYLKQKYSNAKVFISTSGKTDNEKSPFTFEEKKKMMMLAGVDSSAIVQCKSPYQSIEIVEMFDPDKTVVVFAVSEKDMENEPRFDFSNGVSFKKNGEPAHMQKWEGMESADTVRKHSYIATTPTFPFTIRGTEINSASQIRNMISKSDDTELSQILQDLYNVADIPQDVMDIFKRKIGNSTMNENWNEDLTSAFLIEDNTMSISILEALTESEFSAKQIKMAFGILNDPRYKQGNYSGAVAAIEKVAKGLSEHPSVANALKRANEGFMATIGQGIDNVAVGAGKLAKKGVKKGAKKGLDATKKGLNKLSKLGSKNTSYDVKTGKTNTTYGMANAKNESVATDIKDYVDDHKEHFDAYPMDVEISDKLYDWDEYWAILDKAYPGEYPKFESVKESVDAGDLEKLQKAYKHNEDRNAHSENIHMLAQAFGDRGEIKAIEGLLKITKRQGYVTPEQSEVMYNSIHKPYIKKLFPVEESQVKEHGYANEQHEQLEYIHHVLQECGDGNVDNAMVDQAIEYVEDIREQHFNADGSTKSESIREVTATTNDLPAPLSPEVMEASIDDLPQKVKDWLSNYPAGEGEYAFAKGIPNTEANNKIINSIAKIVPIRRRYRAKSKPGYDRPRQYAHKDHADTIALYVKENIDEGKYRGYDVEVRFIKDAHPFTVPALRITGPDLEDIKHQIDHWLDESSMADTLATAKNADINDFHFYSDSSDIAKAHTRKHTLPRIDTEKYQERDGLEGPIMTKSGKVVYYDPKEGSYYDPDTDIYLSYEEWKELGEAVDFFAETARKMAIKDGIMHYSDAKGTSEYKEGQKAAKNGEPYDSNPYESGAEKLRWSKGHNEWRHANKRKKGEPNYGARGQFESEEDGVSAEDLVDIITHRIKMNKELMLSLLGDEGPGPLMNAIENVADFYSGTTEVGSSDVSAMVDAVKKQLI